MKYSSVVAEWLDVMVVAVEAATLVKLSLSKPTGDAGDLKSVDVRPIMVKRELKLSFTYHHKTRDIVKNYLPEESKLILAKLIGHEFEAGRIYALDGDVMIARKGKAYTVTRFAATQTKPAELSHDRAKNRLIEGEGKAYLHALGITDAQGVVLKTSQDKYKQINKYVEILDGLVKQLPESKVLRVADMGSGKGYLTFALYDHLANTLKRKAEVIGVEFRPDMVKLCNEIAAKSGFTGLTFVEGTIADFDCTGTDIVIALHACDTATDDAIAKGVKAGAGLIVVAPCCHKQVRREMAKGKADGNLDFLLQYGTYTERMAEMVTDGLRAKLLELVGYGTNVFEFIADAHTPKNVMIVATKQKALEGAAKAAVESEIAAAKGFFGVGVHQLEKLLGLVKA